MRSRIVRLLLLQFIALSLPITAALGQSDGTRKFTREYALQSAKGIARRMVPVWNNQIKEAVRHTRLQGFDIDRLDLRVSETCNWEPHYDANKSPPGVEYGLPLLLMSQYLQQAYLLYFFDRDAKLEPADIDNYAKNVLVPILQEEQERCLNSIAGDDSRLGRNIPSILAGKISVAGYRRKLQALQRQPEARLNADFIAGFPIFFALLHEAGHYVFHTKNTEQSLETEIEADAFAVRTFVANKVSPTLGIGHLVLSHFNRDTKQDLGCRIAIIAASDRVGLETFNHPPGRYAQAQFSRLKAHYRSNYGGPC